jgi:predicted ArsR family transcriptional regulator
MLREASASLSAHEIAAETGLHSNTARFHLEGLVSDGLAVRETQQRSTPGRPGTAYRAIGAAAAGGRRYRLLAKMLASLIAGIVPGPASAATEAGREWGAYLTEQPPPYQRLDAASAIEKLSALLAELGFDPKAAADGDSHRILLRECPFREVAEDHPDVVCALHLGLMRGALERLRAPVTADRLEPFAEPSLCVARLTAHDEHGPSAEPGRRTA